MAVISTGNVRGRTDYEDATLGAGGGTPAVGDVDVLFSDTVGNSPMSSVIASLTRARIIVAQYFDNLS